MRHAARLATLLLGIAVVPAWAQDAAGDPTVIKTHGIATFGEPALPADFPHLPYVNPDAPKGGEMSQHGIGTFDSYNPTRSGAGHGAVGDDAGTADGVGPGRSVFDVLPSVRDGRISESRDWIIFNLRPEARFSDGSPLTADDVLFTFELLRDKGFPSYSEALKTRVASATVLDTHRIRFDFMPDIERRDVLGLMGNQSIFSRAEFEATGRDIQQTSTTPFLGSGPMSSTARISGGRSRCGATRTIGAGPAHQQGPAQFRHLRFEYFGDFDAAFEAFKAGIYTFQVEPSEQLWSTGYDFPAVAAGAVIKEEIPDGVIASGDAWVFNLRRDKFKDIRVREAIGLMFNFEWSNQALFYGMNTRLDGFWDNSDLQAEGPPTPEELALLEPVAADLPPGILTDDPVSAPVSGERQLDRGNARRAAALLDEAGWTTGTDGMRRNAAGQTLRVEFLDFNQSYDRIVNPMSRTCVRSAWTRSCRGSIRRN
ncbi:ABC transporter substrate-binding protein [Paracoccus marcusii]|uniref:ABC transporter substrate-binding protein n=1 Tax=Paracoccus marcusii TaxID=59779 RepID=UPI002ED66F8D|nr:ABC transporter substrate-binding protein [Paracoccus marcusii]